MKQDTTETKVQLERISKNGKQLSKSSRQTNALTWINKYDTQFTRELEDEVSSVNVKYTTAPITGDLVTSGMDYPWSHIIYNTYLYFS